MAKAKKVSQKDQRVANEKAALRQRLEDMLAGAIQGMSMEDDGEGDILVTASGGMDEVAGWMRAARNYLDFTLIAERWPGSPSREDVKEKAFHFTNLRHFDTLTKATNHLYDYGFRA